MKEEHTYLVLKFAALNSLGKSIIEVGEELLEYGCDELFSGGFWVMDIQLSIEYYSPRFRESLSYEGVHDFPNLVSSWQNAIEPKDLEIALDNFNKHVESEGQHPYSQVVTYNTKDGKKVELVCMGTIIKSKGKPLFMVGSHILI